MENNLIRIPNLYKKKSIVYSFEFFPPKTEEGEKNLIQTIQELKSVQPGFVSVTYGAGGSTRDKTIELCSKIQTEFQITSMSHFTCIGANRDQIRTTLQYIQSLNIQNVIALRGDPPKGDINFCPATNGFANATELIQFIRSEGFNFSLAGGCYPEKHPDSPTIETDIENLKKKVDSGAEFLITQLFFVNSVFEKFLDKVRKIGISIPIIPGIMPITSFNQIQKFKELAACEIPESLVQHLEQFKDDPDEFAKHSLEFTIQQCRELQSIKVRGIHFYTLNKSKASLNIVKSIL